MHFDNSAIYECCFYHDLHKPILKDIFSGKSNMTGIVYIIKDYFNLSIRMA